MFRSFVPRVALPLAMLAASAVVTSVASAQDQRNFTLTNNSELVIMQLFISPSTQEAWGDDVLGTGVLPAGNSVPIIFNGVLDTCVYDIKVTGENAEEGR